MGEYNQHRDIQRQTTEKKSNFSLILIPMTNYGKLRHIGKVINQYIH